MSRAIFGATCGVASNVVEMGRHQVRFSTGGFLESPVAKRTSPLPPSPYHFYSFGRTRLCPTGQPPMAVL